MSGFAATPGKEKLRDELAADVVSRIRGQAAGASAEVKAVLEEIADRLFDEDLLDDLKDRLSDDRRDLRRELRQATGVTGRAFLVEARMEVAGRLLRELGTGITVAEAGRLVGYPVSSKFQHAFKARFEVSPGAWRDLSPPAVEAVPAQGPETCRRVLTGPWPKDVGPGLFEQGLELLGHLERGYPGVAETCARLFGVPGGSPPFRVEDLVYEVFKATSVLEAVREEPLPSRLVGVRYPVPMGSLLLFELLRRGRGNGDDRARLALASLDACAEHLAPVVPEYQALALVSLAREALDRGAIAAAETTLTFAAAYRSQARPFSEAWVEASFLETKAELRLLGGAVAEGFELASRAAGLYRRLGRRREAARCLLQRERARRGAITPAEVAELEEALAGVEPGASGTLALRLGGELAAAYASQGRLEAATSTLGRLRDLVTPKE